MNLIESAKQALKALERYPAEQRFLSTDADIDALREAIAEVEKAEPFGIWHQGETEDESDFHLYKDAGDVSCPDCIKLYTHPKEWVGLTVRQQAEATVKFPQVRSDWMLGIAEAIEAALKAKNGGQP